MIGTLKYITNHELIFLGLAMAAGKAIADPVRDIEYSTIVTAMCRNGVEFGIRVSGLGDEWFTAPAPLESKYKLADSNRSREHSLVDMGAGEYTLGKPHPMIDGTQRKQRILTEARDPQVAILLLDFILGYNASMDPVGELLDAINEAKQIAQKRGGNLTVVASVCGTDGDPQELNLQAQMLR